jgi:hypothetical protein
MMAKEYLLRFAFERRGQIEDLLIHSPLFHGLALGSGGFEIYEFRAPWNKDILPDAHVTIEEDGLFFSDNGGEGLKVFEELLLDVTRIFGPPRIEEL